MNDEKLETYWFNVVSFACGFAACFVFLKYAKRGKILVKRKRFKKNRRYIRLSRVYRQRMRDNDGIRYVFASTDFAQLKLWRRINVDIKFIPKRFKRRVLPWRLIRRK